MSKTTQSRDPYATTFHRDGTVTVWLVYAQQWARIHVTRITDQTMSTLSDAERARIARMGRVSVAQA